MKKTICLLVLVFNIWFMVHGQILTKSSSLDVISINRDIVIDGILEKEEWASIDSIEGFFPPISSTGYDQTVFKSYCSDTYFNFCFNVSDGTIITYDFKEELTVAKEDRVELFFSPESDLSQYYCIEMDPLGRILDYSARYYRKFDEIWDFDQVEIAAQYTLHGYIIEGRISLSELGELGINECFHLGIFRADFKSKKTNDVDWYSWIEPKSSIPDFHLPTAFGECSFEIRD